jgi:hypothetical protein
VLHYPDKRMGSAAPTRNPMLEAACMRGVTQRRFCWGLM